MSCNSSALTCAWHRPQLHRCAKIAMLRQMHLIFQPSCCSNAGTVSDRGMIACSCAKCVKSGAQHSSSEWEVHAGSRERRPAESIYLTELNFSLRVRTH